MFIINILVFTYLVQYLLPLSSVGKEIFFQIIFKYAILTNSDQVFPLLITAVFTKQKLKQDPSVNNPEFTNFFQGCALFVLKFITMVHKYSQTVGSKTNSEGLN